MSRTCSKCGEVFPDPPGRFEPRCPKCDHVEWIRRRQPWPVRILCAYVVFVAVTFVLSPAMMLLFRPIGRWGFVPLIAVLGIVPFLAAAYVYHKLTFFDETYGDGELHCPQCEYILKGLSEPRCPECGREI